MSLSGARGASARPTVAKLSDPLGHLQRRLGRLFAVVRRLRKLEGSGHPVDLDRVGAEPRGTKGLERAGDESLGDALVEAGRHDRKPERPGAPGGPAKLRRATGHISLAATTGGARACRAWC